MRARTRVRVHAPPAHRPSSGSPVRVIEPLLTLAPETTVDRLSFPPFLSTVLPRGANTAAVPAIGRSHTQDPCTNLYVQPK